MVLIFKYSWQVYFLPSLGFSGHERVEVSDVMYSSSTRRRRRRRRRTLYSALTSCDKIRQHVFLYRGEYRHDISYSHDSYWFELRAWRCYLCHIVTGCILIGPDIALLSRWAKVIHWQITTACIVHCNAQSPSNFRVRQACLSFLTHFQPKCISGLSTLNVPIKLK